MADSSTFREIGIGLAGVGAGLNQVGQVFRGIEQSRRQEQLLKLQQEKVRQDNIGFAAGILDANPEDSEAFIEEVLIQNVWGGDTKTAKASPRFKTLVGVFKEKDTQKRKTIANSLRAFGVQGGDLNALASMPLDQALKHVRAIGQAGREREVSEGVQDRFDRESEARAGTLALGQRREARIARGEAARLAHDKEVLNVRLREFESLAQKRQDDVGIKRQLQELKEREFEQNIKEFGMDTAFKMRNLELDREKFELTKEKFTDDQRRFQLTHRLDLEKLQLQHQVESRQAGAQALEKEKFNKTLTDIGDAGRLRAGLALKAKGKDPKNALIDQLSAEEADFLLGEILNAGMSAKDALLAVAIPSLRTQIGESSSIRERTGGAPTTPRGEGTIRIDEDGNVISR